ncbi:37020_t:CDS:2, partial [Racocetra persica]
GSSKKENKDSKKIKNREGVEIKITPEEANRGYAYKRAYKKAVKTAQAILHRNIGNTYEIFHGEWLNFEDFK